MSLLQMSLAGSGMVLVILVVRALTARRLPRLAFQVLWILAALRLLLPLAIPLPILPAPQPAAVGAGGGASTAQTRPDLLAWEAGLEVEQAPDSMAAPDSEGPTGYSDAPALGGGWRIDPLRTIWMAGAVVLALYFLLAYWRGMRLFRACPEEDAPAVRAWLDGHRLRRRVEVRAAPWIEGPLTCGVLRPMILLPQGLACGETGLLDDVLTHEWVHIRRFDGAAKLLFAAAVCVHWFNPLAWVLFVLANRDVELSCDQQVLRILGRERRGGYARALLQMEESRAGSASFYNHFGKHIMKERIEAIMKYKKTSVAAMILALVLVAGTATAFATVPVEQAAAPGVGETDETPRVEIILGNGREVSFVEQSSLGQENETAFEEFVLDGEIGERFVSGDLIFEIVSQEEVNQAQSANQSRASLKLWTRNLWGSSTSESFRMTAAIPYVKVWISNQGESSIRFTITKDSPFGAVVSGSNLSIPAGTAISVYSTNRFPAATYYANFTSGKADLKGVAACRIASTIEELDI